MGTNFTIVNQRNLKNVSTQLMEKNGRIIIFEPGPRSYQDNIVDAQISLYTHPLLSINMDVIKKCHFLLTKRGTKILGNEVWQTNWEDDRDWMLRPIANSDFVRKSLVVGSYEFVIGFQSICGRTLFYNEKAIAYIPNSCPIQPALQYGLELMANALNITNKQSGSKKSFIGMVEIKKIIDYAVEDLKTGKIFGENIEIAREMDLIEQKERMALN